MVLTNDQAREVLKDLTKAKGMAVELRSLQDELVIMYNRDSLVQRLLRTQERKIATLNDVVFVMEQKEMAQIDISDQWRSKYELERRRRKASYIVTGLAFFAGLLIN